MKKVLIAGGSGLIGTHLANHLQKKGYHVRILSRNENSKSNYDSFVWNIKTSYIDSKAFYGVDYLINLSGASIAGKAWTAKRKEVILESRLQSTNLLYDFVKNNNIKLKKFICSSATGYYSSKTVEKVFKETDKSAGDFLGSVCDQWEKAACQFEHLGIPTVRIRAGVVLAKENGALPKLLKPFQYYAGAVLGNGSQYFPWIHIDDICGIYEKALSDPKLIGAYNAVAPEHINNRQMTKIVAEVLRKRTFLPSVPAFILKWILGDQAQLVLNGSRISAQKIVKTGYQFQYKTFKKALTNLIQKNN